MGMSEKQTGAGEESEMRHGACVRSRAELREAERRETQGMCVMQGRAQPGRVKRGMVHV